MRTTLPGIVTGSLLAVARIAGETAPLLFTALGSQYMSFNLNQPMAALPLTVFTYATGPYEEWHQLRLGRRTRPHPGRLRAEPRRSARHRPEGHQQWLTLRCARRRPARRLATAAPVAIRVETDKLTAMYGKFTAVKSVSLGFQAHRVHALIGPSGCGKSTFLRTINRMHELVEGGMDHRPGAAGRRGHLRAAG